MHSNISTIIIDSSSDNPWYNLALEELLFKNISRNEVILYLWQNENTVVIGKNQNPWKECKCSELEAGGGKLARRLSGGGAVYHDLGNLNFSFIVDKELYNLKKQLSVIIKALKRYGIYAEFSGRNDLVINNKKFSGNAFYFDNGSALHHGTLLINTDISKLSSYLQVSKEKIQSKGIDSVESRVVNLSYLSNAINSENLRVNLKECFADIYGGNIKELSDELFENEVKGLYERYSSWEWRYGETPCFDIVYTNKFPWGEIQLGFSLSNGCIKETKIYTDILDCKLVEEMMKRLKKIPFKKEFIFNALDEIITDEIQRNIIIDIVEWLKTKEI